MPKQLRIFSDGGSRGNPGPAAAAYLIQTDSGHIIARDSRYIGISTNNQAEYAALLMALEKTTMLQAETLVCHLDSELVVKQLTGLYKVKNPKLKQLWQKIQEAKRQFKQVRFVNVPRTNGVIQEADKLVNLTLDAITEF
ncbi:MAG TPA: ribonuclease HI family protein [Candidatus Bathyarchaeia archaeon]